jgi:hypothetical protein
MSRALRLLGWVIAFAMAPALAWAQHLGGASDIELPLIRLTIGFLFCALVAIVAALAFQRYLRHGGGANPLKLTRTWLRPLARKVRVLETYRISPNAEICVFASARHEYLVVISAAGATIVETSDAAAEAEAP